MPSGKPHVILLLADNLGYGDVGCFGSGGEQRGMPTPRIDQLANEGVRLNQFLVEAGCTPSRAALMTGRYSIRAGLSLITFPGSNELGGHEFTIGDLFKSVGYRTVYYGKWHLGSSTETALRNNDRVAAPPDLTSCGRHAGVRRLRSGRGQSSERVVLPRRQSRLRGVVVLQRWPVARGVDPSHRRLRL